MSSSGKNVSGAEVNAWPLSRPAEALEVVPGLIITQHSGEGKANQYFLRGFNLDHGTDLAISVDDMPVNMRTHAHGQGYADLNFLIPELRGSVNIRKGPYFADQGDFATVGAVGIDLSTLITSIASMRVGSFGYRGFGAMSAMVGPAIFCSRPSTTLSMGRGKSRILAELKGVLRYSQGTPANGFSLTGMAYTNNLAFHRSGSITGHRFRRDWPLRRVRSQ